MSLLSPDFKINHIDKCLDVTLPKMERLPDLPIEEAERVAFELLSKSPKISICLSGGLDSEIVALSFLQAGLPFTPVIWDFGRDLNQHDTQFAHMFCEHHRLTPHVIKKDIAPIFTSNEIFALQKTYRTTVPEKIIHALFIKECPGLPLIGCDIFRVININRRRVVDIMGPEEFDLSLYLADDHPEKEFFARLPYFFYEDAYLFLSFLLLPEMYHSNMIDNSFRPDSRPQRHLRDPKLNYKPDVAYSAKATLFRAAGFEILDLPGRNEKLHGFENLYALIREKHGIEQVSEWRIRFHNSDAVALANTDQGTRFFFDPEDSIAPAILHSALQLGVSD